MRMLYDVGLRRGRTPAAWMNEPPRLEPAERVALGR